MDALETGFATRRLAKGRFGSARVLPYNGQARFGIPLELDRHPTSGSRVMTENATTPSQLLLNYLITFHVSSEDATGVG